jgi:glucosylceramidase
MAAGVLPAQQPSVQLWITSSDEAGVVAGLEEQPELSFRANTDDGVPTIAVDDRKIYQRMEGGGAAFTDGAAWLISQKLSPVQRDL